MSNTFEQVLAKTDPIMVFGIDPGETTGLCCFVGSNLIASEQVNTKDVYVGTSRVLEFIHECLARDPGGSINWAVAMESYRIYAWKTEDHAWSEVHTIQLIGAIEYALAREYAEVPKMQSAQSAKGFVTDAKLRRWGYWVEGQKHTRDAVRHAIYYLMFEHAKAHHRRRK